MGSLAESPKPGALPELDPERGLAFTATARVVRTAFAVHRLSDDPADRREPERIPTALFVYRSPEHDVRYLELTPLAAEILERLLAGKSLRSTLAAATSDLGVPLDEAVLEGTARLLADLAERGAITGARRKQRSVRRFAKSNRTGGKCARTLRAERDGMMERDPLNIVGQTVAEKYRIERLVGEGGFAVVYRALHTIWNKPVAIKFFNGLSSAPMDQREHFQQAFIQEGALLTELSSETAAIVQARDIGT